MKRICFIGCVNFSGALLFSLLQNQRRNNYEVVAVVTKESSSVNSDFFNLSEIVKKFEFQIDVHYYISQDDLFSFLAAKEIDIIYCCGWSHLLSSSIISLAKIATVGYHPAKLPKNRGRHPIIWALCLGLKETGSSFFIMKEAADAGPIIDQVDVVISDEDNAFSLYQKLVNVAEKQILKVNSILLEGDLRLSEQDEASANFWRKRSKLDGLIDWRMEAISIHNLVRALSPPYPGAHCIVNQKEIKIFKSEVSPFCALENFEPGKVISHQKDKTLIKCGGKSSIWIYDPVFVESVKNLEYLQP